MKNGIINALAIEDLATVGRRIQAGGPGSGRHKELEDIPKPSPAQHKFMSSTLMNDEASTDDELQKHFTSQGIHPDTAAHYISQRDRFMLGQGLDAGGPGSGRHAAGITRFDRDNEGAHKFLTDKGFKKGETTTKSGRFNSYETTKYAHPKTGQTALVRHTSGMVPRTSVHMEAENAGGIHTILDKYRIKKKLAKENPGFTAGKKKKKLKADDALPLVSPRDAA